MLRQGPLTAIFRSATLLLIGMSTVESAATHTTANGIEFRADYYQRDLTQKTLMGKGNAWVKNGQQELFADEIEIDFGINRGVARGNVRLVDGAKTIWSSHADFNLSGDDAYFEKATVSWNQMVITGEVIRQLTNQDFEIEEGTYSNCNVDRIHDSQAGECSLDWKIYGRRFRLTINGYAHFYDVLVYTKNLPMMYLPYLIIPIKTERQSGFLIPYFTNTSTLGSGITVPLYLALGPWHDLLIKLTEFSSTGIHSAFKYRYLYSPTKQGSLDVFLITRRFGTIETPTVDDVSKSRVLGLFGEGAVRGHNIYRFDGTRTESRQILNWVSNPYYSYDYLADLGARADLGNLRSQFTLSAPGDEWLLTAQAQYLQSLIVSRDYGADGGGVFQLPTFSLAKTTSPLAGQWLSYELDTQFSHFYRATAFDQVSSAAVAPGLNVDPDPGFDANDYLRTGQRLQLEPRLVANVPMPRGFQFQSLLRAGSLLYHFNLPNSSMVHREYLDIEVPLAMQLSRVFHTSIEGYEKISHVFQPRFIYASSLFQSGTPSHPFFFDSPSQRLSNPRFDLTDHLIPYEYMRFELINRFQRRSAMGASERFFWFQVSEQYNIRTSTIDPRYQTRLGPLEIFSSLSLGKLSAQLQAIYPLELTTRFNNQLLPEPIRETAVSVGMSYQDGKDVVTLSSVFRQSVDPSIRQQTANLYVYKTLPTFFDLEGQIEYNFLTQDFLSYRLGFHFSSKPRSCWGFSVTTGRNAYGQTNTLVGFNVDLGGVGG